MPDLLVTGASGHFGRLVLDHLLDTLHVEPGRIAAASRDPEKLADLAQRGVETRRADFDDESSLDTAFAGIKRLLIVSTDALDTAGTRLRQQTAAVRAAERAGVAHILYTSLPYADRSTIAFAPDHAGTEKAIAESRIPSWTILRNNWYFENLLRSVPNAVKSGKWYSAAGDGRTAYISREDLALAAATALAADFDGKRTLTLSGPEGFTHLDIASLVSKATGRPVQVVAVPVEAIVQGMVGAGFPEPVARIFASFDPAVAEGFLDGDAGDFTQLTGCEPKRLGDWIAANAEALAGGA